MAQPLGFLAIAKLKALRAHGIVPGCMVACGRVRSEKSGLHGSCHFRNVMSMKLNLTNKESGIPLHQASWRPTPPISKCLLEVRAHTRHLGPWVTEPLEAQHGGLELSIVVWYP